MQFGWLSLIADTPHKLFYGDVDEERIAMKNILSARGRVDVHAVSAKLLELLERDDVKKTAHRSFIQFAVPNEIVELQRDGTVRSRVLDSSERTSATSGRSASEERKAYAFELVDALNAGDQDAAIELFAVLGPILAGQ